VASIFDDLKAGLNSLLDRVAGDDAGPVPDKTPEELRKILEQRAAERTGGPGNVHPIAKRTGADSDARAARERIARKREARVHKHAAQRERADERAREAAFEEAKRQAYAGAGASSSSSSRSSSGGRRAPSFGRKKDEIAKHYETLNLPYGAPFPEVKKAFRALMRKYHPDMHSGEPDKQKAAAELSKQLSVAYSALEQHLEGK